MGQRSRGNFYRRWAHRASAVHTAAERYARSDDESERFQVPNVRRWAASGTDVYVNHYVEHDYPADVSADGCRIVCVHCGTHAFAGQRAERYPLPAYGELVR